MKIVVLGLSVTSSWGNGHATTFRALLSALYQRRHRIVFFEKDVEWYASNRDLPDPYFCDVRLYDDWTFTIPLLRRELSDCDVVILGSYFPDGIGAAQLLAESKVPVKVFYDIDTPITLKSLRTDCPGYIQPQQIPMFDLYLSFTGGPILDVFQREFGARRAMPFYCSFDPKRYFPRGVFRRYQCDLSYMGTYAADRQAKLDEMFIAPARKLAARKFLVAGPQYPSRLRWPDNVRRIKHLSPRWHPHFYSSSRLTLNLTRAEMVAWGYSPSVRLFEAAACGTAIVSDAWPGLNSLFKIGEEVLVAETAEEMVRLINDSDESALNKIGNSARERVLADHSSGRRAEEFESYVSRVSSGWQPAAPGVLDTSSTIPFGQVPSMQPIS